MAVLLAVFTGIVAVSLFMQSLALLGIYRSIRNISDRIVKLSADLSRNADNISNRGSEVLAAIKAFTERFQAMQENLTATTEVVQRRVVEVDAFLEDTVQAARLQVARIQETVDNASRRVEETFDVLQNRVLAPINELNAVITGIRVGLDVLRGRRKRPVNPSQQDEEMFI
jgi:hypothetical protein